MDANLERLRSIKTFPSLVKYLKEELDWPIEPADVEDLTFEYEPDDLGLDAKTAAKIKEIKQLRPFVTGQPWGIFYINFEPKQLPIVALRRILSKLVLKKRASGNKSQQASWQLNDLLFISSYGESDERAISFAHFAEDKQFGDLPTLRVLGWDSQDTVLRLEDVEQTLSSKLRWPEDENNVDDWRKTWSSAFTLRHREVVKTSKELAVKLADLAVVIRQRANKVLSIESDKGPMRKLYKAFQEALIHDLDEDDFADMYAQTIAYGLLTARVSRPAGLVVENVTDMVPITNPFLKELLQTFLTVGGRKGKIDFDELGINEVVELLRIANMEAVLKDFGDRNPLEDPVIHFYELFLKEYDPQKRMKRGVFYTPRPVVSFIVRSVDEILRTEFGLKDGLADITTWGEMVNRSGSPTVAGGPNAPTLKIPDGVSQDDPFVQILDPATGTGTFLVEVIDLIYQTLRAKWTSEKKNAREMDELWNEYVPRHLLPRLHGFELMMAPYAIAHMKIGLKLRETHYSFISSERARVYLTNTLEEPKDFANYFEQMAPALAHEAEAANKIKRKTPITVIIGNPPYSGISSNMNPWIDGLLKGKLPDGTRVRTYYEVDGKPLGEKKLWLQDDYVKFIRYSQWLIERTGLGIHGMITNDSFLDSPTCRGMRYCLAAYFDNLCLLDLHGSSKKQEVPPEGVVDENVFDIQQGVSVSLFYRLINNNESSVEAFDLWATRSEKYAWLNKCDRSSVDWRPTLASSPYYMFALRDMDLSDEYENFIRLKDIFPLYGTGVQTSRDDFAVAFERQTLEDRMRYFFDKAKTDAQIRTQFGLTDTRGWKLSDVRKQATLKTILASVTPFAFRVFDNRWVALTKSVVDWPREEVMASVRNKASIGLLCSRQQSSVGFRHVFVANSPVDMFCLSNKSREGQTLFPLYRSTGHSMFQSGSEIGKYANYGSHFVTAFASNVGASFAPEHLFQYIYAALHSPTYRTRYAEFLKIEFPRIPLTTDIELFGKLCALGADLVALHLLEDDYEAASWNSSQPRGKSPLKTHITRFAGKGEAEVTKGYPKYRDDNVYINPARYFERVPEEVWNFHIGGYQVCEKWLKDRRGRTLSDEDINHYQRVVVALSETIRLMAEIDRVIEEHGGWPLVGSQDTPKTEPSGGLPFA
jgi:predicted helicase